MTTSLASTTIDGFALYAEGLGLSVVRLNGALELSWRSPNGWTIVLTAAWGPAWEWFLDVRDGENVKVFSDWGDFDEEPADAARVFSEDVARLITELNNREIRCRGRQLEVRVGEPWHDVMELVFP